MPDGQTDIQRIEKLDSDVLDTTKELQNLQGSINTLSETEKTEKFLEIEQTIKLCKEECQRLEQENKAENAEKLNQLKANLAKLEQIYSQINQQIATQTNAALTQLSNEAVVTQSQTTEQTQTDPEKKGDEKKGISGWWKGLTEGQRKGIRIGGGVLAGVGIISLFRRRKKSKDSSDNAGSSSREAKRAARREARREERRSRPFWQRPIGKVLKWTAIGGGIYYVVHGLITGKWSPKDAGDWGNNRLDDSVSQVSEYEKLSPEQREKYEKIGDGVNDIYGEIWEKERSLGFEDQYQLGTISNRVKFKEGKTEANYSGLVPFCMDKDSDNIKEILSEQDLNEYFFNKNISELKNKLKGWSTQKLEKLLGPFVNKLQSFEVFGKKPGASLGEKIKNWLDYDSAEREDELNFFFRQYSKVLVFLKDRETILKYKIAESALKRSGYDGKSLPEDEDDKRKFIQNVLEDDEWVKLNIKNNDVYKKFMESKIIGVGKVLESQNISNSEMSGELEKRLNDLDEVSDHILQVDENNETIVDRGLKEIGGGMSDKTSKNLVKMCDNIQGDMVDETGTGFVQEYFEWISYAMNTEEDNRQKFLKESGLQSVVDGMSSIMEEYRQKIKNKTITADDLKKLKQVSIEYVALKKEIEVAMYTMQSIKHDDPNRFVRIANTCFKFIGGFCKSVQRIIGGEGKFGDWLNVGVSIAIVGTTIYIVKHPLKAAKKMIEIGAWTGGKALHAVGWAGGRTLMTSRRLSGRMNALASKGVPPAGLQRYFMHFVLNGQAHEEGYLLKLAQKRFKITANSGAELVQKLCAETGEKLTLQQAEMVRKYSGDKNLRKAFMLESTDWTHSMKKDVLIHNRTTRQFKFNTSVLNELKEADTLIESIANGPQKKYLQSLLKECGVAGDFAGDIKFLKQFTTDNKSFLKTLGKEDLKYLKKLKLSELRALDKAGTLKKFVNGKIKMNELLSGVPRLSRQAARVEQTALRQAEKDLKLFNTTIDNEISRLSRLGDKGKLEANAIERLKALKAATHTDDEAKAFLKLMDNGFDAKYLAHLDDLFKMKSTIKVGEGVYEETGKYLKKLLVNEADYVHFRKILNKPDVLAEVKRLHINTKPLVSHMDDLFKFEKGMVSRVGDDIVKALAKVLRKIL